MLAMTEDAAAAVERIVSRPDVPETAVVRITAGEDGSGETTQAGRLALELVEKPSARDLVVGEMRISVEPRSLAFLDDKLLDAEPTGGEAEFRLLAQPNGS